MAPIDDRKMISTVQASDESGPDFTLGDIWKILRKHRLLIVVCAVAGLLVAGIYIKFATPIFEATASLRIDPKRSSSLGLDSLLSASGSDSDLIKTEATLVTSDTVVLSAITTLGEKNFTSLAGHTREEVHFPSDFGMNSASTALTKQLTEEARTLTPQQESIISRVARGLIVKPVEGTQLITVSFRNKDPQLAATLVNRIIASYLRNSFDSRYSSTAQVQEWLSEQLESLKQRASLSQKRLAEYQKANNLVGTDSNNNTIVDRFRSLNDRLGTAQADRLVREAQMRAAQGADVGTLATLYPNIGIQALQQQQAQLYAKYADMAVKFGSNYPPLAQVAAERKLVDKQLDDLANTTRIQLKQAYDVSRDTELLIQKQFDEQTAAVYAMYGKQADYAVLQADAAASRDLYDRLQYQLQQAGVTAGLDAVNTMLVSTARTPHVPVEPRVLIISGGAFALGLFVGVAISFILDSRVHMLQSAQEIESELGLAILAVIPRDPNALRGAQVGIPVSAREPNARISESFRTLRNSILLSMMRDQAARSVLITSSLEGEGKSLVASNYAVVLAQHGHGRVLLVDCDLRRPTQHTRFGLTNQRGLSELILNQRVETIQTQQPIGDLPNLHLITAGAKIQFASEALGSVRFQELLAQWEQDYMYVVLDSPPILVVSDALPLAKLADAVILVARFDRTPEKAARRSVTMLQRVGGNLVGAVMNDIPSHDTQYGAYYGNDYYEDRGYIK